MDSLQEATCLTFRTVPVIKSARSRQRTKTAPTASAVVPTRPRSMGLANPAHESTPIPTLISRPPTLPVGWRFSMRVIRVSAFRGHCIHGDAKATPFHCDRLVEAHDPPLAGYETGGPTFSRVPAIDMMSIAERRATRLPGNNLSFCRHRDHRLGGPKDAERCKIARRLSF